MEYRSRPKLRLVPEPAFLCFPGPSLAIRSRAVNGLGINTFLPMI